MATGTRDHGHATNRRGRATVLAVSLTAFAAGTVATLLGHEEALGLMVLALLAVVCEVVAWVARSSGGERPRGERR